MRSLSFFIACAFVFGVTVVAGAQTIAPPPTAAADPADLCGSAAGETGIAACNRALASGKFRGAALADIYIKRGQQWSLRADYDRAFADFDRAIEINAQNPAAFNARAGAWLAKGDLDHAIADFNAAIRIDAAYAAAYSGRGLAYEKKGDRVRARADFSAALALPARSDADQWAHDTAREKLAAAAGVATAAPPAPPSSVSLPAAKSTAAAPAPSPAATSDPNAAARRDYEFAAQVGTREAWEAYLKQYQTGFYADLAKAQLTKLSGPSQPDNAKAERERLEKERVAREQAEQVRLASQKAEREQLEKERAAREKAQREEAARADAERKRLADEEAAREKAQRELTAKAEKEHEREAARQAEKERIERERVAREQADRERSEKQRLAREQAAAEHSAKEQAERERLEKERVAREQVQRERQEKERLAREQAEKERPDKEQAAKQQAEEERQSAEAASRLKTAELTPPKDNIAPDSSPASGKDALVREIKKELKRVGCYSGAVDDNWPSARASTRKFIRAAHVASAPDQPTTEFLDLVRGKSEHLCPLECKKGETESGGNCVAKICSSGYQLDEDGDCVRQKRPDKSASRSPEASPSAEKPRSEKPAAKRERAPEEARPSARREPASEPTFSGEGGARCAATSCSAALAGCMRHAAFVGRPGYHCQSEYSSCLSTGEFIGRRCQRHGLARN